VIADPDDVTRPMLAPSCTSAVGVAAPAHRLQAFLDGFGDRATSTTICNDNLTDALTQIGEMMKITLGVPCLDAHLADRNPSLPGVQPECAVTDVLHPDDDRRTETIIPACDTTGGAPGASSRIRRPARPRPTTAGSSSIAAGRRCPMTPRDPVRRSAIRRPRRRGSCL
jgi:hypothetical protein